MAHRSIHVRHPAYLLIAAALLLCCPNPTRAQRVKEVDDATPLTYHNEKIPAGQIANSGLLEGYMPPITRTQLESMLRAANARFDTPGGKPEARLVSAAYRCQLEGDGLRGTAVYDVSLHTPSTSYLSLDPCGLAISEVTWEESREPAKWGVASNGMTAVIVEKSGRLMVRWSVRGARNELGRLGFDVRIPACAASTFTLTLPANLQLSSTGGIWELPRDDPQSDGESKLWTLHLGTTNRLQMGVSQERPDRIPTAYAKYDHAIRLSSNGLELTTEISLDVPQEPLSQIQLKLDPTLTLLDVQSTSGQSSVLRSSDTSPVIMFENAISGANHKVIVRAVAPLIVGKIWRIPTLNVASTDWREGAAVLSVSNDFELQSFDVIEGAAQLVRKAAESEAENHHIQFYGESGTSRVMLAIPTKRRRVESGTRIEVKRPILNARVVADISSMMSGSNELLLDLGKGWIPDEIRTEPEIDFRQSTFKRGGETLLKLTFDTIKDDQLRLIIQAHAPSNALRISPMDSRIPGHRLRVVEFPGITSVRSLFYTYPNESQRLKLTNEFAVQRQQIESLSDQDKGRLNPNDDGFLFLDGIGMDRLILDLIAERPTFDATIDMNVTVEEKGNATEEILLAIRPQQSAVKQLLIELTNPRLAPTMWKAPNDEFSFTSLSLQNGRLWQITLDRARSTPFTLVGTNAISVGQSLAVALPVIREATRQEGVVRILAKDDAQVNVEADNLTPIPVSPPGPTTFTSERARFHFEPSQLAQLIIQPTSSKLDQLRVWNYHASVTVVTPGKWHYRLRLSLENEGERYFSIAIPSSATEPEIRLNGIPQGTLPRKGAWSQLTLIESERFAEVELTYWVEEPNKTWASKVRLDLPEVDCFVFGGRVDIRTPPGIRTSRTKSSISTRERLLGPFSSWTRAWVASGRSTGQLEQATELLIERFDRVLLASLNKDVSWQNFLSQALDETERPLFVDLSALQSCGIRPSELIKAESGAPQLGFVDLLRRKSLAVLYANDRWILTSNAEAARVTANEQGIRPINEHPIVIATAPLNWVDEECVEVARWGAIASSLDWKTSPPSEFESAQHRGWGIHSYEISFPAGQRGLPLVDTIMLYPRYWDEVLGLIGVFTWFAVLLWVFRERIRMLWLLWLSLGLTAVFLPIGWYLPVSHAFVGCSLAFAASIAIRGTHVKLEPITRVRDTAERAVATATIVTMICLVAPPVMGQEVTRDKNAEGMSKKGGMSQKGESTDSAINKESPITGNNDPKEGRLARKDFAVRYEVDADGKPSNEWVWLPKEFYHALLRRADKSMLAPLGTLMRSAVYEVRFNDNAQNSGKLDRIIATYVIETFEPNQVALIPLGGETTVIRRALLDGSQVNLQVNNDQRVVHIERPGRHVVEIEFNQPVTNDDFRSQALIPIPKHPNSKVILVGTPPEDVNVASISHEELVFAEERTSILIGPANQLQISWKQAIPTGEQLDVRYDKLLWMRINPNAVTVQCRIKAQIMAGNLKTVELLVDPRLQLRSFDDTLVEGAPVTRTGALRSYLFTLTDPATKSLELNCEFFITETSHIGQIRIPTIKVVGERVTRRWLAISADDQIKTTSGNVLVPLEADDFGSEWGGAAPQVAYRLPPTSEAQGHIVSSYHNPTLKTRELTHVSLGLSRAEILFTADVTTEKGAVLGHQIWLPNGFELDSVVVNADGQQLTARSARPSPTLLNVFLSKKTADAHQISVRGRLRLQDRLSIPDIRLNADGERESFVQLYRLPETAIRKLSTKGFEEVPNNSVDFVNSFGRPLPRLKRTKVGQNLHVNTGPNLSRSTANIALQLEQTNNEWWAHAVVQLTVNKGTVDSVRLQFPEEWEWNQVTPESLDVDYNTESSNLIATPKSAIHENSKFEFTLSGRINVSSGLVIPDIRLLDIAAVKRWLVVPTRNDSEPLQWTGKSIRQTELPDELKHVRRPETTAYEITDELGQVQPDRSGPQLGTPIIHLEKSFYLLEDNQTWKGAITTLLEPNGLETLTIVLSNDTELVEARSGSKQVPFIVSDNQVQVRVLTPNLPIQMQFIVRGQLNNRSLRFPTFLEPETKRRLATFGIPSQLVHDMTDAEKQLSNSVFRLKEMEATSTIAVAADKLAKPGMVDAFSSWASRYLLARSGLITDENTRPTLEALDKEMDELATRAGKQDEWDSLKTDVQETSNLPRMFELRRPRGRRLARFELTGNSVTFGRKLPSIAAKSNDRSWMLIGFILIASVLGIAVWIPGLGRELAARPEWSVIIFGGLWCVFLSPQWFGWLLLTLGISATVWPVQSPSRT